jgi:hypothetical protein
LSRILSHPIRLAVVAILTFWAFAGAVIVMRLSTDESADNRLTTLTFGPTLNEAMGRGWQEVSWSAGAPPTSAAASFRQGVLFLDVLTALRARQRAITLELLPLLEEALAKAPESETDTSEGDDRAAIVSQLVEIRGRLEKGESFDAARAQVLALEPRFERTAVREAFELGLFVEQGRLTFEHGKMAPRSWQKELEAYLLTPSLPGQLSSQLEELQAIPTRSGKMAILELLLRQFGDGKLGFASEGSTTERVGPEPSTSEPSTSKPATPGPATPEPLSRALFLEEESAG